MPRAAASVRPLVPRGIRFESARNILGAHTLHEIHSFAWIRTTENPHGEGAEKRS